MTNLAVFVSGSGTTLQRLIDACENKEIEAKIGLVVSNSSDCFGVQRATKAGIDVAVTNDENEILKALEDRKIELVVLAGYLKLVPKKIIAGYRNKIINLHPALLPAFGGKGMYGIHVHEEVIASGVKKSGSTVHYVDETFDTGKIIQQCFVNVEPSDTAESLQKKIMAEEKELLVNVLKKLTRTKNNQTEEHSHSTL